METSTGQASNSNFLNLFRFFLNSENGNKNWASLKFRQFSEFIQNLLILFRIFFDVSACIITDARVTHAKLSHTLTPSEHSKLLNCQDVPGSHQLSNPENSHKL